jgi:hypothetical protein
MHMPRVMVFNGGGRWKVAKPVPSQRSGVRTKKKGDEWFKLAWLRPRLVHIKEMGLAIVSDTRAIWPVNDGTIRADDVHHTVIVFVCALRHLVWL